MEELAFCFLELAGFKGKTVKVGTELESPCWVQSMRPHGKICTMKRERMR